MLKLAPPPSNESSGQTIVIENVSAFNLQGFIDLIDADFPIEVDGLEFNPNLSTVASYDWNEEVYE